MIATAVATNGINHHASALTSQRLRGGRRIGGQRHCGSGKQSPPRCGWEKQSPPRRGWVEAVTTARPA